MLERNLNRVRQDGGWILERTAKREGWGAAVGSSERTFGAPRPVLNRGLTQRDMEREDPPPAPPAPPARPPADPEPSRWPSRPALYAVITEVEH